MAMVEMTDEAARMIGLLTQQELLYRQLHQMAHRQTELVDGSRPELLLKVLAGRQRLIDRLTELNQQLEPLRARWTQIAGVLTEPQRQETQRLVGSVRQILSQILDRDEKDSQTLSRQKEGIAGEIRTASQGRRMNQAYAQQARPVQNRFLDTQSL
jgi:hypothetical protein